MEQHLKLLTVNLMALDSSIKRLEARGDCKQEVAALKVSYDYIKSEMEKLV